MGEAVNGRAAGGRKSRRRPFAPTTEQAALLGELQAAQGHEARRALVAQCVAAGCPLRTVAAAAQVSHDTVHRWARPR